MLEISKPELEKKSEWLMPLSVMKPVLPRPSSREKTLLLSKRVQLLPSETDWRNLSRTSSLWNLISSVESLKKPSTLQLIKATTFPSKSTSSPRDQEAKEISLKAEDSTTTEDKTIKDHSITRDLQEDSTTIELQEKTEDQDKTVAQEKTEGPEKTDPNAETTTGQEDKKITEKAVKTEDLNTTTDHQEETIMTETSTEDNHKLKATTDHQEDNRDTNHAGKSSVNADQSNGPRSIRSVQEMIESTSSSR